MLPGIRIHELSRFPDERGSFCELLRDDWKEFLEDDRLVQANMSSTYPGVVRAWHRHARGQVDYFALLQGAIKICAYDDSPNSDTRGQLTEIISSREKPQIVRIPGHYWHGFKVLGTEPALLVYFVTRLYDRSNPDEERRPWNDSKILDPHTGVTFDWNRPPYQ
jgi:dTDP-4-dehydrorhamnose 3,5-epimerase